MKTAKLLPIILAMPLCAMASPKDMLILMDSLCMGTDGDIPVIERMVLARGGKALPASFANADPATARYGGKGFILTFNDKKYAVMAANNGGCSILGQGISAPELKKLITGNYSVLRPDEDSSGSQTVTFWKVKAPSQHQGGAIMLNSAKEGFGADGAVSIGFLPARLVKKCGHSLTTS